MYCPRLKCPCREDCAFNLEGKCLQAEYYKEYIVSSQQAGLMMKTIFPALANLPKEVKEQLPQVLREQLEEIIRRSESGDQLA